MVSFKSWGEYGGSQPSQWFTPSSVALHLQMYLVVLVAPHPRYIRILHHNHGVVSNRFTNRFVQGVLKLVRVDSCFVLRMLLRLAH